ncbi:MAG: glucosylceramidase, partial [Acholeplasmataceae bacterium]
MTIIESSKNGGFLKEKKHMSELVEKHMILCIDETQDQIIQGFGGAFTEASAYNLSRVEKDVRRSMLEAYFHPTKGAGYTMGRISIHSCDFSIQSYDYVDAYDETLESFDISRDQPIIDMILEAQSIAGRKIDIIASPWSPPFWMKTNGSMIKGGELIPKYYGLWATYIIKFIQAYEHKGVIIDAVTIQ